MHSMLLPFLIKWNNDCITPVSLAFFQSFNSILNLFFHKIIHVIYCIGSCKNSFVDMIMFTVHLSKVFCPSFKSWSFSTSVWPSLSFTHIILALYTPHISFAILNNFRLFWLFALFSTIWHFPSNHLSLHSLNFFISLVNVLYFCRFLHLLSWKPWVFSCDHLTPKCMLISTDLSYAFVCTLVLTWLQY